MNKKLFVVYDSKKEAYGTPFFADFTADALREWSEVASNKSDMQNQIAKYPADFTLFEIGTFNILTGELIVHETKHNHGLAVEHIKESPVPQN